MPGAREPRMAFFESTKKATTRTRARARLTIAALCVTAGCLAVPAAPAVAVQHRQLDSQFTGADTPDAGFAATGKVDPSTATGDVYVVDSGLGKVNRFNSAGVYQSQLTGF